MPKLKTRKGAAKRFKVTGSGKIRRSTKSFRNHILTKKTSKRKRQLRRSATVDSADEPRLRQEIPYR